MLALCLLLPVQALAEGSPGSSAAALPLNIPLLGQNLPPSYRTFQREPDVKDSTCAVSADELPTEFLTLMKRLDEPVAATETGLPPVVEQVVPAIAEQAERRSRRQHGVQVLGGGGEVRLGRSRENGVTVYRGLEPERGR